MSSTQHTSHYNLPTFGDNPNDRPSWRGDFTDAMTKIDNQMYTNATNITTATAAANNATTAAQQAKESADNAAELAQTNKTDITEQASYFNALGVTSVPTAQSLISTINGKAENTALTALQGTVSGLSDTVDGKADATNVYTKAQADTRYTQQGGYSGTAQSLKQTIDQHTTSISNLTSWINAFASGWTNLGDFTYSISPSTSTKDDRSNIRCYYNEEIKAIKVFGFLAVKSTNTTNFKSISVRSTNKLPSSLRPSSDIHMDAAMIMYFNGETAGVGAYSDINIGSCCVTVKTDGTVLIGEHARSGYLDNIADHARQSVRVVLPQCIYVLDQWNS